MREKQTKLDLEDDADRDIFLEGVVVNVNFVFLHNQVRLTFSLVSGTKRRKEGETNRNYDERRRNTRKSGEPGN
jgi:hypothetical protein